MCLLQKGFEIMNSSVGSLESLHSKNIKPSYPRIKILEYLINNRTHPTVDEIYLALVEEIPTLSKTTVYNTLKLFLDHELIRSISIENNESRYDVAIHTHGHFKCESCENIYDFDMNADALLTGDLHGFTIYEKNIYFKGICKKCSSSR